MEKLVIEGGKKLSGTIEVSGSKNSALAIMSASLLAATGVTTIHRIPDLKDIHTLSELMRYTGASTHYENHTLTIDAKKIHRLDAPYDLVKKMRASIYVLGPLLSRFGSAKISFPGGCAFGPRPIDLHIEAMKTLGAEIDITEGYIFAKANHHRLHGAKINFKISSVGATVNTIMAASLAKGTTQIKNAAIEPEIPALCNFLVKMGAKINPIGEKTLEIEGVDELHGVDETNAFDRIEAGTFLVAAAITGGNIVLKNVTPKELDIVLKKLQKTGCVIETTINSITLKSPKKLLPINIIAEPYPKFPTDMQAQWSVLMTQAHGKSKITDNIYLERFKHVPELNRLNADMVIKNNSVLINGKKELKGATVMSTDLRASASLVLAGLVATGETHVTRLYHIDRGYEKIEEKLQSLGASIRREKYDEFSNDYRKNIEESA